MDLEQKLKSFNELSSCLDDIKKSCNKIWENIQLPWFTKHDISHSEEIIHLLGQILIPIEGTDQELTEHELFILLASAYLHDIGMQNLKIDDIPREEFTSKHYETIRKSHAQQSHDIILKGVNEVTKRDDFHLPIIKDDYLPIIANVSKGHATDFFDETIEYFQQNPSIARNIPIRAELLASLLMIADELDLHSQRADFSEISGFTLSNYSLLHWYKHHYVYGVEIKNAKVDLTLSFPDNADKYKDLIIEFIKSKLTMQMAKVNPILNETTSGKLSLNNIQSHSRVDDSGVKRELPDKVLDELMKTLKKSTLPTSDNFEQSGFASHRVPIPTKIFTGMKDELERFKGALKKSNLISIEGIGGIGKSEFAAKCIEEYLDQEKTVWFDCGGDTMFETLIESCGYPDLIKGDNKTELAKHSGFVDLIERDVKVIFLDNFQDVMDISFKNFFTYSNRKLRKSKFIIISREHPQMGDLHVFPVCLEGLKTDAVEYARKIIKEYYPDVSVGDENIQNVCDAVNGHPFAIDLAIQLLHYGETSDNIIGKLVHSKDKNEELSGRLLDEVFNHPKSTAEEKEFLLNFSVFKTKVLRTAFDYISEDNNKTSVLHKLMDKHMIIRNDELYGTHPLVREFCYYRLQNKKELHHKAYEYLKTMKPDKLDIILEQEIFYHLSKGEQLQELSNLISDKGEDFILTGNINFLKEVMDHAVQNGEEQAIFWLFYGDIDQIKGEWKESLNFFKKSFSFPNVDKNTKAMAYIRYGEILYRKGDVKESLEYFKNGLDICKKIDFKKGEARSLNDIGLVNKIWGEFDSALDKIKKALGLSKEINDKSGIATALNNMGGILCDKGESDKALEMHNDSLEIRKEIDDKAGIAMSLNNIGVVLTAKGELDNALKKYDESLIIYKEIGNKAGIATSLCNVGSVLHKKGELNNALEKLKDSLEIAKEIGNKIGIATSQSKIGGILADKYELDNALKTYEESLIISKEIGNKMDIAIAFNNIGLLYAKSKDFLLALENLLKSQALNNQMGTKGAETYKNISEIRNIQGLTKFKKLADEAINKMPPELKPFVKIDEFVKDKTLSHTQKTGRNVPCPCGSGKRFKKCCGQ
ncbi:MAG: tetratricopeptide repeat protein [Candidatus Anammoxibacter sp.]